jgi:hypothetical protein
VNDQQPVPTEWRCPFCGAGVSLVRVSNHPEKGQRVVPVQSSLLTCHTPIANLVSADGKPLVGDSLLGVFRDVQVVVPHGFLCPGNPQWHEAVNPITVTAAPPPPVCVCNHPWAYHDDAAQCAVQGCGCLAYRPAIATVDEPGGEHDA